MAEIDWTASMQQTYKFYVVDPDTWRNKRELDAQTSASINRDDESETLETATIETTELLDECYVRIYLVCNQNGDTFEFPLGTFLVQTPSRTFNGHVNNISIDASSPLIELRDSAPPYGFAVMEGQKILETASDLVAENARAPVVRVNDEEVVTDNFVSDFANDTWLTFIQDFIASAGYKLGLDEMGRILFVAKSDPTYMKPVWTYTDDNSSILMPEVTLERDMYGLPNVVEVLYSNDNGYKFARVENRDDNSPLSIQNRGREIIHRESNPDDLVNPTQKQLEVYAEGLLRDMSMLEATISYTHGYCPVRVGDCVMLNYRSAGLTNIKAVVKSQGITCEPGCQVSETATFTTKLWG